MSRYLAYAACIVLTLLSLALALRSPGWWWGFGAFAALSLLGTLDLDPHVPRAETGGNSAFRLASVWGRFEVGAELAARLREVEGPVLLVDDLVDSRWTVTVAARELRRAGAPAVLPFALAAVA